MERKLTAILSADVEGYSRLMGDDEEATIRTLTYYHELMTPLIKGHRGRVVDSPGDNLLAEFGSVVDAVKCAAVIQTTLRMENADLPQNRRMEFRIGINLGDVIVDGERIYGDGVNIAARMEALAEGGGICVSGTVFDQVKGKVSVSFEDLGLQQVKNIAESIRAYRAVLGSGTVSAGPQKKVEVPRQDHREASNLYNATLTARLSPVLYKGIEDVLHRFKETISIVRCRMNIEESDNTVRPGVGYGFFKYGLVVPPLYIDGGTQYTGVPTHGKLPKYASGSIKDLTIAFINIGAHIARYFTFSNKFSYTFS